MFYHLSKIIFLDAIFTPLLIWYIYIPAATLSPSSFLASHLIVLNPAD